MSSSIDQAILQAEKDAALAAARTPVLGASPGGPGVELLNKDVYVDSTTGSTGVTFAADPGVGVGVPRPTDTSEEPKRRRSRDHDVDGDAKREPLPFLTGSWKMLTGSHLNWLLVFLPVGVAAEVFKWSEGAIFGFNCLAILPLAKLLGDATEQVAMHTNDTIGGLLNATFGNATELIVSLFALFKGLLGVVQVSLLGSIISNTLLVLGCSCIAGGIKKPVQRFNATAASANTTLLLMSILGMSIPACLASLGEMRVGEETDLMISRLTAIILLFLYCLYIYFQLVTHRLYFEGGEGQLANLSLTNLVPGQQVISRTGSQGSFADEEEEEELMFSLRGGLFWLGVITVIIAFLSEFLTGAIEGARWQRPRGPRARSARTPIWARAPRACVCACSPSLAATRAVPRALRRRHQGVQHQPVVRGLCHPPHRRQRRRARDRHHDGVQVEDGPRPRRRARLGDTDLALRRARDGAHGVGHRPAAGPLLRGVRDGGHVRGDGRAGLRRGGWRDELARGV